MLAALLDDPAYSCWVGSASSSLSSSAKPGMPLSGVRSSCDMVARKADFCRLASSASLRASSSRLNDSSTESAMRLKELASSPISSEERASSRQPLRSPLEGVDAVNHRRDATVNRPAIHTAMPMTTTTISSVDPPEYDRRGGRAVADVIEQFAALRLETTSFCSSAC